MRPFLHPAVCLHARTISTTRANLAGIRGFVETGECPDNPNLRTATPAQKFVFNILPDIPIPLWIPKIIQGNPVTFQWPLL